MLFSSMIFLWLFLPFTFIVYRFANDKVRNLFLLVMSLLFYAWGEPVYIVLMIAVIFVNYVFGILIDRFSSRKKILLISCIAANLLTLGYFKYFDFFAGNINRIFGTDTIALRNIILPIGISFYIFQTLSYVVDLYRGDIKVQRNIINLALYTSFFPQLIAGPIVKYHDIENQINHRELTKEKTAYGIKRFIYGLSKKVILSNTFAEVVDNILNHNVSELSSGVIWLAIILYTLQIYFDFSGYSDMAIGLAKMFGFDLNENFNYPYLSKSITEFWRRWHISLSTWFKEYVYIPLGGNRKGKSRTYINLSIVFLLTGIWHGASFNFIAWGAIHGFFIVVERIGLSKIINKNKITAAIAHVYTLGIVIISWTFFRANSLTQAGQWLKIMFFGNDSTGHMYVIDNFVDTKLIIIFIFGIILSGLLQNIFKKLQKILFDEKNMYFVENIAQLALLGICIVLLVNDTYNPFIYFKF